MKPTRLQLRGISARRLILVPEERREADRGARPRIRRYRLGVLTDHAAGEAPARAAKLAPPSLAHALRA